MRNAVKKAPINDIHNHEDSRKADNFRQLLKDWKDQSEKITSILKGKEDFIAEGRSHQSLMALGAMESHINIAVQALKASEIDY